MGLTYTQLTRAIERLGGSALSRGDSKVVFTPGGIVAGRLRVIVTLEPDYSKLIPPIRARRLLNRIKDRLQGQLSCTLQAGSGVDFSLLVEEAGTPQEG